MTQKIEYLDGLRGVSSLIVVFHHFVLAFYPAIYFFDRSLINTETGLEIVIGSSPLNLFVNGRISVCIFFVLSGYVLTYKCFSANNMEAIISNAYRRYFRLITPVFIISLVSYIFINISLFKNVELASFNHGSVWLGKLFTVHESFGQFLKRTFLDVFIAGDNAYNTVLWTMATEFKGSFLVFGISIIFGHTRKRLLVYTVLIFLTWNGFYLAFILGMMMADFFHSRNKLKEKYKSHCFNILILVIGIYLGTYPTLYTDSIYYKPLFDLIGNYPVQYQIIGASLVVFAICNLKCIQLHFSKKIYLFLGRISFALYLIHPIILGTLACSICLYIMPYTNYSTAAVISTVVSIVVSLFLSYLFTKYIDETNVKLSRNVYKRYFANTQHPIK